MRINEETGEILEPKLNEVIIKETRRPNGSLRIQQDFSYCPTLAEQHQAHMTNVNYLIAKYKPDELERYLQLRASQRREIIGHDFSQEPSLQGAKNVVYQMRQRFEALPEEIKKEFKSHVDFIKFIDNPANAEKMIKLGLLKQAEIKELTDPIIPSDVKSNDQTKIKQEPK